MKLFLIGKLKIFHIEVLFMKAKTKFKTLFFIFQDRDIFNYFKNKIINILFKIFN